MYMIYVYEKVSIHKVVKIMNGYLTFKDSPKKESYLYHNHISLNSHLCTNHLISDPLLPCF